MRKSFFTSYLSKPYINATPLNIFNWKFINAWNIWKQRKDCDDQAVVRQYMGRYMNRYLFYLLMLPAMGTKKLIKIWGRLSASMN